MTLAYGISGLIAVGLVVYLLLLVLLIAGCAGFLRLCARLERDK